MGSSRMTRVAATVEHVGAVVRFGDAPAAQRTVGIAVNQVIAAEQVKNRSWRHGRRNHYCQTAVAITELLEHQAH
ncbi:hypothetical protein D3C84_1110080 [compost metagenome]